MNRAYRGRLDRQLTQRHPLADYFFDLLPVTAERLERIFALGSHANVEIETHPANFEQYRFLRGGEFTRYAGTVSVMRGYVLRSFAVSEGTFRATAADGSNA